MSEQREVKPNMMFVVYSSLLSSNREENTGRVVSLLSSTEPERLQWNDRACWGARDKITFTDATEDLPKKVCQEC